MTNPGITVEVIDAPVVRVEVVDECVADVQASEPPVQVVDLPYAHPIGDGYNHLPPTAGHAAGDLLIAGDGPESAYWGRPEWLQAALDSKVDRIAGKGLSTEDYTSAEKSKLSGVEPGATADQTPAEILAALKGVDGPGSGLDADTLDGLQASAFATAAQGAKADSAVQPAALGTAAAKNVAATGNAAAGEVVMGNDSRLSDARTPTTHTHAIGNVTGLQTALDSKVDRIAGKGLSTEDYTSAEKSKLSGVEPGATADQTPAEILAALKGVDGPGSGLDADTLDGLQASAFATAAQGARADTALQPGSLAPADVPNLDASKITSGTIAGARLPARLGENCASIPDWNNAVLNGWYMALAALNAPEDSTAWFMGNVEVHHSGWVTQIVHAFSTDNGPTDTKTWRRERNNGTWGAWHRLRISEAEQRAIYLNASNLASGTVPAARLPTATVSAPGIVKLADSLTSDSTAEALTAAQGKALKSLVDQLQVAASGGVSRGLAYFLGGS